jgi:hypothetical protein
MRYLPRALLAGGMGFAAAALVACGGSGGLLSSTQAGSLNNQLDQLAASINAGQCTSAAKAAVDFSQAVNSLPGSVDPTLSNNLKQGAAAIGRLTIKDCGQLAAKIPTTPKTTTTPTTSTKTNTTPTTPTTNSSTSGTGTTPPPPTTSTATTGTGSGTTSTGNGGAGLPGGNTSTGGNGGAGTGNGNGR